ncbi:hypothetical protein [Carnobacterium sp. TMP28]|uniref:hypothetical protein n=1 Tax=Carnobacterium sp. TMP28 TaxID=3397060 RepID=UPI0039E15DF7
MEKTSLLSKWKQLNDSHNEKWSTILLFLLSSSFALTDWMFGIFTFTEYVFLFIGGCLVISAHYQIKLNQLKWILLIIGVILVNILINELNNEPFVLKVGLAGLIKVTFYLMVNVGLYNYVMNYGLEEKLLKMMNSVAVVVGIIGIYITIALYSDGLLPYEFFWTYTRTDVLSYSFNAIENLVRTRSVFSEPSYLGYYLTIIIGMNLFNKRYIAIPTWMTLFLTLTVILTFSYSSIAVLVFIYLMHFISLDKIKEFRWVKTYWLYVGVFATVLFVSKDIIYQTIIKRTIDIINGKDFSALFRIVKSWDYVNKDHLFMGNGIGHTPSIWNIYAYILSDLGLIAFILVCLFSLYLVLTNYKMGILFIVLNFQKGGYLSSAFWIYLLLLLIYVKATKKTRVNLK